MLKKTRHNQNNLATLKLVTTHQWRNPDLVIFQKNETFFEMSLVASCCYGDDNDGDDVRAFNALINQLFALLTNK